MKIALLAFAVVASLCFVKTSVAQDTIAVDTNQYFEPVPAAPSDTSVYDLGRVSLQKKFIQAITIKAADLEKMPFYDLQEALVVYYNGIYGARQKFIYVIDGILNTDVNALSIFDIDEITFVQNAANALNGVLPSGVLVLVKTKRGGAGKSGIMVNGQTNAVKRLIPSIPIDPVNNREHSGPSPVTAYHHYYISAYKNTGIITTGISASIQHNTLPQYQNNTIHQRFKNFGGNRFKINGYVDIKFNDNNSISFNTGYVPQRDAEGAKRDVTISGQTREGGFERFSSQNLWYANIQVKSVFAQRISNKFSAGFQRRWFGSQHLSLNPNSSASLFMNDTTSTTSSFIAKDDISYQLILGSFTFNPAVNITYRQSQDSSVFSRHIPPSPVTFRGAKTFQKMFMATPSLTVNFAQMVTLQAGVQKVVSSDINFNKVLFTRTNTGQITYTPYETPRFNDSKATPLLPFASLGVSVSNIFGVADSTMAFNIYASFAKTTSFVDDMYGTLNTYILNRLGDSRPPIYDPYNPGQMFNQIQGGINVSVAKNTLSFSYNYSQNKFRAPYYFRGMLGVPAYDTARLTDARVDIHRLGINFSLPGKQKLKWTSSLNGTIIMNKGPKENYAQEQLKLIYNNQSIITGGFLNQLSYKKIFAGINILYGINSAIIDRDQPLPNSLFPSFLKGPDIITLQNVYLGYQLKVFKKLKYLDVYINARNLFQKNLPSDASILIPVYAFDENRYFGGGFKLGL